MSELVQDKIELFEIEGDERDSTKNLFRQAFFFEIK